MPPSRKMPSLFISALERRNLMLVPYLLLTSFYLYTYNPVLRFPPETLHAAVLKAVPIWYLALYMGFAPKFPSNAFALAMRVGLALSSLGDVCLIWRDHFFLPGMLFFALAQVAYFYGIMSWMMHGGYPTGRFIRENLLLSLVGYYVVYRGIESWIMSAFVLGYCILLFAVTNLALQRHLVEWNRGSFLGLVGHLLFSTSDFFIGVARWLTEFPASEMVIMVTYYAAQAAIAYGVVRAARVQKRR